MPACNCNFLGWNSTTIAGTKALATGKATIRFEFDCDGGGIGKCGDGSLLVNGKKVATGRIERTQPIVFWADETADVGIDVASPDVEAIGSERKSRFNGRIPSVMVAVQ